MIHSKLNLRVFGLLLMVIPAFAFEHAVKLKDTDDLSKFSVIIQNHVKKGRKTKVNADCTGVIISPTQILTLYYCIHFHSDTPQNINSKVVAFGVDGANPVDTRKIKGITPHPNALNQNRYRNVPYDVVIIELDRPIPTGFRPIAITDYANSTLTSKLPFDIFIVGAGGYLETGSRRNPYVELNYLRYVQQKGLIQNFDPLYMIRHSYPICLDEEEVGFEYDDLGGPAVFFENGEAKLIGLTSGWVASSRDQQVPGTCGFQKTAVQPINETAAWIKEQIKN